VGRTSSGSRGLLGRGFALLPMVSLALGVCAWAGDPIPGANDPAELARIIHAPRREKCVDECKARKPQGFRALPGIVPAKQPASRQTLPVPLPHATAAQRLKEARTSCVTWEEEGSAAKRWRTRPNRSPKGRYPGSTAENAGEATTSPGSGPGDRPSAAQAPGRCRAGEGSAWRRDLTGPCWPCTFPSRLLRRLALLRQAPQPSSSMGRRPRATGRCCRSWWRRYYFSRAWTARWSTSLH
jgi:hypothetical protein